MSANEDFSELVCSAPDAARRLLGCELERTFPDGSVARVRIVETEAYDQTDPGSHTFRGKTPRNNVMFGPAGFLYVYFIYGMHYCCNVVTGPEGFGEAVLIRAVEPVVGEELMSEQRGGLVGAAVSNGPSKVCSALSITRELNGHDLRGVPLRLYMKPAVKDEAITTTPRIGLKKGADTPWRFYITNSAYVSRPHKVQTEATSPFKK